MAPVKPRDGSNPMHIQTMPASLRHFRLGRMLALVRRNRQGCRRPHRMPDENDLGRICVLPQPGERVAQVGDGLIGTVHLAARRAQFMPDEVERQSLIAASRQIARQQIKAVLAGREAVRKQQCCRMRHVRRHIPQRRQLHPLTRYLNRFQLHATFSLYTLIQST